MIDEEISPASPLSPNLVSSLLAHSGFVDQTAVLLFGEPSIMCGGAQLKVPEGSKRLLALVALSAGRVDRRYAAGMLWPMGSDQHAAGSLRSALWRLKSAGINVLESDKCTLSLRRKTIVDVSIVCEWAARLISGCATQDDVFVANWRGDTLDLLPACYDDWLIFERERIRQRLLHALEALSRRFVAFGRPADAVDAAIWAVSADPLRESANRILIEAYLAEGNLIEASRAYRRYRDIVRRELGIEPSRQLISLVQEAGLGIGLPSSAADADARAHELQQVRADGGTAGLTAIAR
jgi:DNA-binding SARP family transcriptional activator